MRRRETLAVFLPILGFVGWIVYGIYSAGAENEANAKAATAAGFASFGEMTAARAGGVTDPTAWRDRVKDEKAKQEAIDNARHETEALATAERYAAKVRAEAALAEMRRNPIDRMEIETPSWKTGGFGSVAIMTVRVSNSNDFEVKDIAISCRFSANSGTVLNERSYTIYETIKPKSKRTFKDLNVGFINSQAARGGCSLASASRP